MKRVTFACDDAHGLDANMSGHFGRCPYYTIVDIEEDEVKNVQVIANPFADNHIPGKVPHFIKDQKANVMIAGGMACDCSRSRSSPPFEIRPRPLTPVCSLPAAVSIQDAFPQTVWRD